MYQIAIIVSEVEKMTLAEAIKKRIENLCKEKNMNINKLAIASGINPATIRSTLKKKFSNPNTETLYYICIGLDITMTEFFNDKLFDIENIHD